MTIAGLDSGGGAGIIADVKTFSALGVWGLVALTAVTAQNTKGVFGVQGIEPELVRKQIKVVAEDIGIDAAKTGMLYSEEIINAVAEEVSNYDFPLVVDPVMYAKSGDPLLKPEAREALIKKILPLAKVVTPNIPEAEALVGWEIRNLEDMKKAARYIVENYGSEAAIVKGGHLTGNKSIDIMYYEGEYHYFETPRIQTKNTHGTGCTYSAAIAAELAKGKNLIDAVKIAKQFIFVSIAFSLSIGEGHGPVNHMAWIYRDSERYYVLKEVADAQRMIEGNREFADLIPEVGMNIALALTYALDRNDVVAIPGRIRLADGEPRSCCPPKFGASKHLASYVLTARKYNEDVRAAINIRYSEEILKKLGKLGLTISSYDRSEEPKEIKDIEGRTIPWGTEVAIKKIGEVPDVIYHKGDYGKEPMIVILGKSLKEIINTLKRVVGD